MIDPVAAIIAHLSTDADLTLLIGTRIGSRHRYGLPETDLDVWPNGSQALVVQPTGGEPPDDQAGQLRLRVEVLAYGDDQVLANQVASRVRAIGQAFIRSTALMPDSQTALIYWFSAIDSPAFEKDPDLQNSEGDRLDLVRQPYRLAVADTAV